MQYGNKLFAGKEQYKDTVDLKQCVQHHSSHHDGTRHRSQPAARCLRDGQGAERKSGARCCEKPKVLFACATT